MEMAVREKVDKANKDIETATRLEVDLLALGQADQWWKDSSKIEAMKQQLESRELNEALNVAVQELLAIFASTLQHTRSLLDRGLYEVASHCFKLIVTLYMESRASKDGLINEAEEIAFVDQIIAVEGSFIHGVSIPYVLSPVQSIYTS